MGCLYGKSVINQTISHSEFSFFKPDRSSPPFNGGHVVRFNYIATLGKMWLELLLKPDVATSYLRNPFLLSSSLLLYGIKLINQFISLQYCLIIFQSKIPRLSSVQTALSGFPHFILERIPQLSRPTQWDVFLTPDLDLRLRILIQFFKQSVLHKSWFRIWFLPLVLNYPCYIPSRY